ncbi:hypothetical protein [Variovorax saccharolyticus]|uniref:hypothetical protein n=1 Tax=Variovorax saccharolyticus TaxID=3053516 RepID=UPI002576150D|nr:hypothetical protein [Variovorax sp. J31P216]MDM0026282.1 hypothetical protein [Variovorax sp. J31P216]
MIAWDTIDDAEKLKVPAKPAAGLWTMVRTRVIAPAVLRIEASGSWRPVEGLPWCGPDGLRHWAYGREQLLTRKAPLGALIGKFGGSNGAVDEADIFVIGSVTVLQLDKNTGPLYLTINDAAAFFDDNEGALDVIIR